MESNFDQSGYSRQGGWPATAAGAARLDWPALAARLAAAHATRRILTDQPRPAPPLSGSFAPAIARQLVVHLADIRLATPATNLGFHYTAINPDFKAGGKPGCSIGQDQAGVDPTGVQGRL